MNPSDDEGGEFFDSFGNKEEQSEKIVSQGWWTKDEHNKFMEAVRMFGKDWNKVHTYIGSRNSAQTRSHA